MMLTWPKHCDWVQVLNCCKQKGHKGCILHGYKIIAVAICACPQAMQAENTMQLSLQSRPKLPAAGFCKDVIRIEFLARNSIGKSNLLMTRRTTGIDRVADQDGCSCVNERHGDVHSALTSDSQKAEGPPPRGVPVPCICT